MVHFNNREEILDLVKKTDNSEVTGRLTAHFLKLKQNRTPFYLDLEDLEQILHWKLRGQYGRQVRKRKENTNENVIAITRAVFSVYHPDSDIEVTLRLRLLTTLSGVEIPVASAILTLCFPDQYCVIVYRNWRQFHQIDPSKRLTKTVYTPTEYIQYLKQIRQWAKEFDVTPQEIDIAIWQKDQTNPR